MVSEDKSIIDMLRDQIKELQKQREEAILEKGLAAEENKDLRENFAYDYWVGREDYFTYKIGGLLAEIYERSGKKVALRKIKKSKGLKRRGVK